MDTYISQTCGLLQDHMQTSPVPSHTSFLSTPQVDRQAQFIQGYRVLYRLRGGAWLAQDVQAPAERSAVLEELHKGQEYELKIRPYFDEFQGMDSEVLTVHMPEEGQCCLA